MDQEIKFEAAFKVKVATEALKENKTLAELAQEYHVAPSMIMQWKEELLSYAEQAFDKSNGKEEKEIKRLRAERDRLAKKAKQLTVECDFFAKACEDAGPKAK